jgi:CRP-like cAMP-binding protein
MLRAKNPDPKAAALRTAGILRGLTDRQVAELTPHVDEVHIPAGSILMEQGRSGHEAFLVVDGTADVIVDGELVAEVGPGDLVGEVALIDHRDRTATVIATSRMKVLAIAQRDFGAFVDRAPVAAAVTRTLVGRLRQQAHWTPA